MTLFVLLYTEYMFLGIGCTSKRIWFSLPRMAIKAPEYHTRGEHGVKQSLRALQFVNTETGKCSYSRKEIEQIPLVLRPEVSYNKSNL